MSQVTLNLNEKELAKLAARAGDAGISPEELAEALVRSQLDGPREDVAPLIHQILEKNQELYKRLS